MKNNLLRTHNVRLVHLLLDPKEQKDIPDDMWMSTMYKQEKSIECFDKIKTKFSSYVQSYSILNRDEIPAENCAHPEIINYTKEFVNNPPVLSYGHYGAFMAHKRGIIENFHEDIDVLIVIEGDVVTDLSPDEFYNKVIEAYHLGVDNDARLISFASRLYLSGSNYWEHDVDFGNWVKVIHFVLGSTYLIFRSERESIIEKLKTTGWHSPDIWLAWNYSGKCPIFVSKKKLVRQIEGISMLDYKNKEV
jgi:hypothetical protein